MTSKSVSNDYLILSVAKYVTFILSPVTYAGQGLQRLRIGIIEGGDAYSNDEYVTDIGCATMTPLPMSP